MYAMIGAVYVLPVESVPNSRTNTVLAMVISSILEAFIVLLTGSNSDLLNLALRKWLMLMSEDWAPVSVTTLTLEGLIIGCLR